MDYAARRERVYQWMGKNRIAAAFVKADPDVHYLTGMPGDSVLFLFERGSSILLPWDEVVARNLANADEIIPYTDFDRDVKTALKHFLGVYQVGAGKRVEAPSETSYTDFEALKIACGSAGLVCRSVGLGSELRNMRAVKDAEEIALLCRAADVTNQILESLEERICSGKLRSEFDIAHFLEREARSAGAEEMGFETIVAGCGRSNTIHAVPSVSNETFSEPGCGIIDFGVKIDGYTSDITTTFVFGPPTDLQNRMLDLVERAYEEAVALALPGGDLREIARHVDALFESAGHQMPHSLGHGVGLEIHEAPWLRSKSTEPAPIEPGMVFTIEPGLYSAAEGGVRLENDVVIEEHGARIITNSRIVRLPDLR